MMHNFGAMPPGVWAPLALAVLIGGLAGWMLSNRRAATTDRGEAEGLRAELAACTERANDLSARLAVSEARTAEAEASARSAAEYAAGQTSHAATVAAAMASAAAPAPLAAMAAPHKPAVGET